MNQFNFSKVFAAGYRAISKLIIYLPTEQKSFTKDLRFSLARTAKKIFPTKSVAKLSHMTGMLRSQIDDALDNEEPLSVMDTESIILSDLWRFRDKDNLIPINGKTENSFQKIAKKQLKGKHSTISVMESLIKSGSVKQRGKNLEILSNSFEINYDQQRMINETGIVMNRLVNTMLHNMNAEIEKLFYQSTVKSTKIPPSAWVEFHKRLYGLAVNSMQNIKHLFEEFEEDVPNGTYCEYGFSMYEFDEKP